MSCLVDIQKLQVRKGNKTICQIPELQIVAGEHVGIVGGNGTGKSTLLRIIGGLEDEYSGRCRIDVPSRERVYVHQSPFLFRGTTLSNVTYGLAARRLPRQQQIDTGMQWLRRFGIDQLSKRSCRDLSGGEQRRVALARAFALEPEILLLDEPAADLDEEGIDILCRVIEGISAQTIVLTSPVTLPVDLHARVYRIDGAA
ncbi:MAG TPA: ATP-binding cassette domain-containing protein [Pirellulales bacterium]|nr:ATP-binding cassette domain-containing protein [Pirellulales bacterium]